MRLRLNYDFGKVTTAIRNVKPKIATASLTHFLIDLSVYQLFNSAVIKVQPLKHFRTMKPIFSAVVYKYNKAGIRVMYVKVPCESKAAAEAYAKVLQKWWSDQYSTTVDTDWAVSMKTIEALDELPF